MCWWLMVAGLPADFTKQLRQARVVGVLRANDAETAYQAALVACQNGLAALEITYTTPQAAAVIERLRSAGLSSLIGAGTVTNAAQAQEAIRAGAQFLVSPHLGEDVLKVAQDSGIPYVPGVLTPTEINRATELGAGMVKLFPAGSAGGPAYVKDLLGPFPHLKLMVTGGITPSEVPTYLQAGALAVGLGGHLFPKKALQEGDWPAVAVAVQQALQDAQ